MKGRRGDDLVTTALEDIATRKWRDEGGRIAAAIARDGLNGTGRFDPRLRGEVEPREGMVTVYDHEGSYLGCMGIERWRRLLEEDAGLRGWPPGGLPHGEHPYDYGYGPEESEELSA